MPPRLTMNSWKWFLLSFLGGGIVFWIPALVIPALDRNEQGDAVIVACPIILTLFYFGVLRFRKAERSGPSTAIFAICGMWMLALSMTTLAQWIRSQEGIGFEWWEVGYILLYSFMPLRIVELMMLGGDIVPLTLGTVALINFHVIFERDRWIVPPSLSKALRRSKAN
jgi:hypothetical protein